MKIFILIMVQVVFQQLVVEGHEVSHKALKFGKDPESYVLLQPSDMNPLRDALSICSWIKRMSNHNSYQCWLSYVSSGNSHEVLITDSANLYLFQDWTSYTAPALTIGGWHHVCISWAYSTGTKRVYYDGEQIGTERTPSGRKLQVPGSIMLGQYHYSYGGGSIHSNYYFGGELYDTNVFSTQLSAEQVKEMYTQGRCANYSQSLGQNTFLSWQDILLEDRTGSVTEVELVECTHTHPEEEETTDDVEEENAGTWQFLRGKKFYNKLISEELLSDMTGRMELLGEFFNHTIDDALISHVEKHHSVGDPGDETEEQAEEGGSDEGKETSEDSLDLLASDNWKFLTDKIFYNKVITEELLSDMTVRLELLAEFTGHRCDNALIQHLEKHHS